MSQNTVAKMYRQKIQHLVLETNTEMSVLVNKYNASVLVDDS